jgi:hypothetical protein
VNERQSLTGESTRDRNVQVMCDSAYLEHLSCTSSTPHLSKARIPREPCKEHFDVMDSPRNE